jgi:transcriptional regulator with XRE-family HTH domain
METFGGRLRAMRLAAGLGLQELCRQTGLDAGNYSRIERGLTLPPRDHRKLEPLRLAFGLEAESEEWTDLLTLADLAWGVLPRRILTNERVRPLLPALLQRLGGRRLTEQQIEALVRLIRSER